MSRLSRLIQVFTLSAVLTLSGSGAVATKSDIAAQPPSLRQSTLEGPVVAWGWWWWHPHIHVDPAHYCTYRRCGVA